MSDSPKTVLREMSVVLRMEGWGACKAQANYTSEKTRKSRFRYYNNTYGYCQNISLYEPEQSLSLSQDEGEQCW